MKNITETLEKLQSDFIFNKKMERFWSKNAIEEEAQRHWKKAKNLDDVAQMYEAKADATAHTYAFIKEIDWVLAYRELFDAFLEETREAK